MKQLYGQENYTCTSISVNCSQKLLESVMAYSGILASYRYISHSITLPAYVKTKDSDCACSLSDPLVFLF